MSTRASVGATRSTRARSWRIGALSPISVSRRPNSACSARFSARVRIGPRVFADLVPLVDGLNKSLADMLVTSEYAARPRRWATGIELEEEDVLDADGLNLLAKKIAKSPDFMPTTKTLVLTPHPGEYLREDISTKHWIPRAIRGPLARFADWFEKRVAKRLSAGRTPGRVSRTRIPRFWGWSSQTRKRT